MIYASYIPEQFSYCSFSCTDSTDEKGELSFFLMIQYIRTTLVTYRKILELPFKNNETSHYL